MRVGLSSGGGPGLSRIPAGPGLSCPLVGEVFLLPLAGWGVWGLVCGVGVGLGVRSLFENCTVNASIFVAKLVRAHGGCLGTRSR